MHSRTKSGMNFCNAFSISWLLFILGLIPKFLAESSIENNEKFSDGDGTIEFNHLVVDKDRGWVFIGAENRIYKLYPNLTVNESIFGNEKCPDGICPSEIVHNPNKILVLDYERSRLISCHSRQGSCAIYKIEDLSDKTSPSSEPVTVSNPNASTVAFVAPAPLTQSNDEKKTSVLYVGVTYGKDENVPAVSTRSLEEKKLFRIFKSDLTLFDSSGTEISFNNIYREKYIVNYVYGFSSKSYSYFLTTQMESVNSSLYVSKLIRICQQDENYNSYTEIPIKCTDRNKKDYNLVQAAYIAKPSIDLAKSLGITLYDDVLFGVFSRSKELLGNESNKPSDESALCVYSLNAINDKFTENIQNCYEGKGDHGLEYINILKYKCIKKPVMRGLCGITLYTAFGGYLPVEVLAVTTFDTLLTAVTAVAKSDFTLVITGTYTGRLLLIALMDTAVVLKFKDIHLDETSPVNSDLHFDEKKEHLYAMTEHELTRINIRDHLPSISDVKPDKGPWEGGTKVNIAIKNFDNLFKGNHLEINVAGIPCIPSYEQELYSSNKITCITNSSSSARKFHSGPIEILVNGVLVIKDKSFTFVDLKIINVSLNELGSDATELIIEGEHLNAGNTIEVFIGNEPCSIFNSTFDNINGLDLINCRTNVSSDYLDGNITVKIDRSNRTYGTPFRELKKPDDRKESTYPFWQIPIYGIPILYLICATFFVVVALILIIIAISFVARKKLSESSRALMKMQKSMNNVCMETLAFRQCIKQLVIEKNLDLNEEFSSALKLPNITIVYTTVPKDTEAASSASNYQLPLDGDWEFPRSKLVLGKKLGEGEFGKVLQGEALDILHTNVTTIVAVKMLKDIHSDADMIALASEMEMMKLIGTHENVLRLLGCCTQDGDLLVITEYALHGNLRDFLRKQLTLEDDKFVMKKLCEKDLLMFAVQIANGMEYLASIKCIHRDLAARNVLVTEDYAMKIGDFGLARDIHQNDYYRKKSDGRLPAKWMAPESLWHSIYTSQSDVWSYGILLWEIMTLGGTPYASMSDVGGLYHFLHSGYRMEKPPNCSQMIYNLMLECWNFLPESRPSFSVIVQNLEEIISVSNDETFETCNLYKLGIQDGDI